MTASGDLEGTGISMLEEHNGVTLATFQWDVTLTSPLLRRLSRWRFFHNLFTWNHDYAMRSAVRNMQKRVHHAA